MCLCPQGSKKPQMGRYTLHKASKAHPPAQGASGTSGCRAEGTHRSTPARPRADGSETPDTEGHAGPPGRALPAGQKPQRASLTEQHRAPLPTDRPTDRPGENVFTEGLRRGGGEPRPCGSTRQRPDVPAPGQSTREAPHPLSPHDEAPAGCSAPGTRCRAAGGSGQAHPFGA